MYYMNKTKEAGLHFVPNEESSTKFSLLQIGTATGNKHQTQDTHTEKKNQMNVMIQDIKQSHPNCAISDTENSLDKTAFVQNFFLEFEGFSRHY